MKKWVNSTTYTLNQNDIRLALIELIKKTDKDLLANGQWWLDWETVTDDGVDELQIKLTQSFGDSVDLPAPG